MVSSHPIKVLVVLGPTASGKSALALRLAQEWGGEIINADSRQFYKELNIGTAKPTDKERAVCPHHLIDIALINEPLDVARFVTLATEKIQEVNQRNKVPLVVGGTGLYLKALFSGISDIPKIAPEVRETLNLRLLQKGLQPLYEELKIKDPAAALRLKPTDTQRILRALEVVIYTNKPIDAFWQSKNTSNFEALKVGLEWPRNILYDRINERVKHMMTLGLKEEVLVLNQKYPDNSILKSTIGYKEWFEPDLKDSEVIEKISQNTRQFAKRQLTWFLKETDITWYKPFEFEQCVQNLSLSFLKLH